MNETTNGANCSPEQGAIDTTWKPKILAFCCNWCTYAGADLAGLNRMECPADIRLLRVPCSGRVNPQYVLKAYQDAATASWFAAATPAIATMPLVIIMRNAA